MELGLALGKRLRRPISGMDRGFHSYPAARDVIVSAAKAWSGGLRAFRLAEILGSLGKEVA